MSEILICEDCKGENVEVKIWVDANTNKLSNGDAEDRGDRWCNDCEKHVNFEVKKK